VLELDCDEVLRVAHDAALIENHTCPADHDRTRRAGRPPARYPVAEADQNASEKLIVRNGRSRRAFPHGAQQLTTGALHRTNATRIDPGTLTASRVETGSLDLAEQLGSLQQVGWAGRSYHAASQRTRIAGDDIALRGERRQ
jgi:hypothetical protein